MFWEFEPRLLIKNILIKKFRGLAANDPSTLRSMLTTLKYLIPEVHTVLDVDPFWEALVLLHVVGQGVVPVGHFPLGQEDGVVEPHLLAARHPADVVGHVVKLFGARHLRLHQLLKHGINDDRAREV